MNWHKTLSNLHDLLLLNLNWWCNDSSIPPFFSHRIRIRRCSSCSSYLKSGIINYTPIFNLLRVCTYHSSIESQDDVTASEPQGQSKMSIIKTTTTQPLETTINQSSHIPRSIHDMAHSEEEQVSSLSHKILDQVQATNWLDDEMSELWMKLFVSSELKMRQFLLNSEIAWQFHFSSAPS